ncbi:TrkH family potassium uptake protein [Xylanibacillus composti]|uniref:Ktr system potassium uptake protein D n=1 Tax=Xylanibacillus composti TaxID=1572762 RepID=A0A8J4H7A1_9BACL|nr:TrkH family potassium uptake protein [Xylanibacillus composti]MDT9724571.1 TrkH family potassium uptake protein [Xylanibacillus composti]GIQ70269.1 ktr system potassium uptake protein D [Xylanibacillus composti]
MRNWLKALSHKITPTQFIVCSYATVIAMTTLLLVMPISVKPGAELSWIDALFTAVSGVSVTGLTAVNTAETFSVFGTFVLMISFQFGGIGIMALGTFLWLVLGRNISLSYRRLIMIDQNRHNLSGLVQLIRLLLFMALGIELAGALIFGVYFRVQGFHDTWTESFYYGLFHAVSSYTNAGFDIYGNSLASFANDYFVQFITMLLLFLGAIGFPVLIEFREFLMTRNRRFRFSLFTKVTTSMFVIMIVAGALSIFILEHDMYFADKSWHEKLFFSLFNSITTRSGGLSTMDVSEFYEPTQFILSILMFIGASPSSVGGGIRTTTFAIILLTLYTYAKGRSEVRVFRKSVKDEDVRKSFVVFTTGAILVVAGIVTLDWVEQQKFSLFSVIFEVSSAFGTSGLSMGITGDLSTVGKVIIMALMFVGRIGILSLLFLFRTGNRKEHYHYPKEDIIIG